MLYAQIRKDLYEVIRARVLSFSGICLESRSKNETGRVAMKYIFSVEGLNNVQ